MDTSSGPGVPAVRCASLVFGLAVAAGCGSWAPAGGGAVDVGLDRAGDEAEAGVAMDLAEEPDADRRDGSEDLADAAPEVPCSGGQVWYRDRDGDAYGVHAEFVVVCPGEDPPDGHVVQKVGGFDCDDADPDRHPNAEELCDGKDNDCDDLVDNRPSRPCKVTNEFGSCVGKESCSGQELVCYARTPGPEACNGEDDDCDGDTDGGLSMERTCGVTELGECTFGREHQWCQDGAWTGWVGCDAVLPAASERCDGKDDDCDGETDEGLLSLFWPDADGDGLGGGQGVLACEKPPGASERGGDCNDGDAFVNPDAAEACNGKDDDCDGETDEGVLNTYFKDLDGDGFGDPDAPEQGCSRPAGAASAAGDCNDLMSMIHPGAVEGCAGAVDEDCDGTTDCEDDACAGDAGSVGGAGCVPWFVDSDGDGLGLAGTARCSCAPDPGSGHVAPQGGDCDDTVVQCGTDCESDEDLDGIPDCSDRCRDLDGDGYGETVACGGSGCGAPCPGPDCNDLVAAFHPGAPEACNNHDDDCDQDIDEDFSDKWLPCDAPEDIDLCATGTWQCSGTGEGLVCLGETRDACKDRECGPDGCGGSCGECTAHRNSRCVNGACECVPDTCETLGRECGGTTDDGCGGALACGPCGPGFACDASFHCVCPTGVICWKTCCAAGETCQGGVCSQEGPDPSGTYAIAPAPYYSCAWGIVTVSFSQLAFVDTGSSLTITPAMNQCCMMTGDSAADGSFAATCTCPGECAETYSLSGTFSDPGRTFEGTFKATFAGSQCDLLPPACTQYQVAVTGTKP